MSLESTKFPLESLVLLPSLFPTFDFAPDLSETGSSSSFQPRQASAQHQWVQPEGCLALCIPYLGGSCREPSPLSAEPSWELGTSPSRLWITCQQGELAG